MLRNLGIEKRLLCRPTRWLQNIAGPLDVSFTSKAIRRIGRNNKITATELKNKSKMRFIEGALQPYGVHLEEKSFWGTQ
jgi:hypothetical protein